MFHVRQSSRLIQLAPSSWVAVASWSISKCCSCWKLSELISATIAGARSWGRSRWTLTLDGPGPEPWPCTCDWSITIENNNVTYTVQHHQMIFIKRARSTIFNVTMRWKCMRLFFLHCYYSYRNQTSDIEFTALFSQGHCSQSILIGHETRENTPWSPS